MVRRQLTAVFEELRPDAIKTGMLFSAEIIRTVARFLKSAGKIKLVVDPVMISTSGTRLLKTDALRALEKELLPLATLVTPNLDEASILVGRGLRSVEDMRAAAKEIARRFGCAALVKGGHLRGGKEAVDVLCDDANEWLLTAPFVKGRRLHGTGCTYAAAVAANLARGFALPEAVAQAKEYVTGAIAHARQAGGHWILNHA
jgi:hydroxymethylpyrimidine/phosphomethylpyrimidine kinase